MPKSHALVILGMLAALAAPARPQSGGSDIPTIDAGLLSASTTPAPDRTSMADEVLFDGSLARGLARMAGEATVRIQGWPIAPAVRRNVVVTRHDVYAASAAVYTVGADGRLVSVPRSQLVFFWGAAEGDPSTQVLVAVDPVTQGVSGFASSLDGDHELLRATGPRTEQLLARSESLIPAGKTLSRDCSQGNMTAPPASSAVSMGEPAPAITSLHTATVAVDTDNELMLIKFANDTTAATNYLATLIATMNVMYERDLLVRLVQGQTFLRVSTTADPYAVNDGTNADSNELYEFGNYWIANYAGVPRALAMMISGKSTNAFSSSGIAWIKALCAKGSGGSPFGGYSFTKVFMFAGATGATDAKVVGHELGHNFGSPHTHCALPGDPGPIDGCYNKEPGCYTGPTSCPAKAVYSGVSDVEGTVMSYCHLLAGCSSASVFHPRTIQYVNPLVEAAAAGVSACVIPFVPPGTRTVCASGCAHTKIQDAINASSAGNTILIMSSYDSLAAGEVFPLNTNAVGSSGAITITGETDGSGQPTTTVKVKGPGVGFDITSPGSIVKDLKLTPGDATSISRVIGAAKAGGSCPSPTNCHLNGLTIRNLVIDFTPSFNAVNAIDVMADNALIDKVTVKGVSGNAIKLDGDNNTIQNSTLDGFNGAAQTGLVGIGFAADQRATGAACSGFPTNYTVSGNTIRGFTQTGIKWCLARNAVVATNTISDILDTAIDTSGSQGTLIQGNAIRWTASGGTYGIGAATTVLQACNDVRIIGNRVTGRSSPRDLQRGIVVQSCTNSSVTGNVIEFLANSESLLMTATAGTATLNTVQGNTVQNGNGNGIVYNGADAGATALDQSVVRDNVVLNHGGNGIVVTNLKGPGNVIAYNIVRSNNLSLLANTHGFNMSGLSGTVFAANEGLDTRGGSAAGFSFANSQNISGNCNFGAGNAGGLLSQTSVTPIFVNTNDYCRYGLYNHFDFDGDGKSDTTVYRNSTGEWISRQSSNGGVLVLPWGAPSLDDIPAPGNYNSSTRTDIAVYRYTTGEWIIRNAATGGFAVVPFGAPTLGDIPVPASYTQPGLTDVAVFRSSTAEWFIKRSDGTGFDVYAWGCPSCADIPVPGDYDGDGRADIAVYRRSSGEWYIRKSSDGSLMFLTWGTPVLGDLPVPGRFSTPGKTDVAVYRSLTGQWIIRNSVNGAANVLTWGTPSLGDVPVPGDYSQPGTSDVALYRLLTGDWIIRRSTDGGVTQLRWGDPARIDSPLMAR